MRGDRKINFTFFKVSDFRIKSELVAAGAPDYGTIGDTYRVSQMPDPKSRNGTGCISDPNNYLSAWDEYRINNILYKKEKLSLPGWQRVDISKAQHNVFYTIQLYVEDHWQFYHFRGQCRIYPIRLLILSFAGLGSLRLSAWWQNQPHGWLYKPLCN